MAAQTITPIDSLPIEILQGVATLLPPQASLNFMQCIRRIHDACDQLNTWRQTVQLPSGFRTFPVLLAAESRMAWKKFAIADAKSHTAKYDVDLLHWLPQAMSYHRKFASFQRKRSLELILITMYRSGLW